MESGVAVGIISACSVLSGTMVSQIMPVLSAKRERKHQMKVLMRAKYEEMMGQLNDSLVWIDSIMIAATIEDCRQRGHAINARRIYAMALLYFPLLKDASEKYLHASLELLTSVTDGHLLGGTLNADRVEVAASQFQRARMALDAELEKCAGTYISN